MKNTKLRIVFAGTPEISKVVLSALIESEYDIVGVFTQPDRMKGRGKKVLPSPVKTLASEHDLKVFQPVSFRKEPEYIEQLKSLKPDVMIVVAYGLILPKAVLEVPKYGCINIHVSLLPKWRGAAPIQRAIEAGDRQTGVSIMQMDEGLDTGDVLHQQKVDIDITDTSTSLHDKLAELSIPAVKKVLSDINNNTLCALKQDHEKASYAHKISKEEGRIDFSQSVFEIERKIRAFTPWPSAYFMLEDKMVKVSDVHILEKSSSETAGVIIAADKSGIQIQTKDHIMQIAKLQFPGKKMMDVASILNGHDLTQYIGRIL